MTVPIEYVDELDPFLSMQLPEGWVRALAKHPLQAIDGEPNEIDRMFAQELSPGLPDDLSVDDSQLRPFSHLFNG